MNKTNVITQSIKSILLLMLFAGISVIQGCSSSGSQTVTDADPVGYYDSGTATVKLSDDTTDLAISDLQGMVSGTRFMFLSVSEVLLYDGTITDISGNSFTATVNIYEDGVLLPDTATVSGTITSASSITGTLTGVGAGNGTFSMTYSLNNADSDLSRVAKDWLGPLNGAASEIRIFNINGTGDVSMTGDYLSSTPVISGCTLNAGSTILPIAAANVYSVTITLSTCTDSAVNGEYTGYATTQSVADGVLLLAYTNGTYSASGVLPIL